MSRILNFRTLLCLLLSAFSSLLLAATSQAKSSWWNEEWTIRKKITVDTAASGGSIAEPIGTATLLLRLHDGDFQFGAAKEDGSDLRFVATDDKTLLPYHIEKFDALLNEAFVWVKVPDLKPGAQTSFWMYYGNNGPKAVKAEDAKATYEPSMALVYHFGEKGAPPTDVTGNGNNGLNPGIGTEGSMIGSGLRLSGTNAVNIAASDSLAWNAGGMMTWSAWIKPTSLAADAVIFSRREANNALVIGVNDGAPYVEANGQRSAPSGSTAPIAVNTWHHLAVAAEGVKLTVYLDGEPYAALNAALPALKSVLQLGFGALPDGAAPEGAGFVGELDELQISKGAEPAGAIKLAALTQGAEKSKVLTLGQDEQTGGGWLSGNSTFAVLIRSLTVDGWVVIGILIVMAGISWYVMISKASFLNAAARGNALFLRQWREIATDLTVLDSGDEQEVATLGGRVDRQTQRALRASSVYRIYHIGAEEIRNRLGGEKTGVKTLSPQSIHAIRAMLDGGMVRESQRLNNLMVLLTIAISGGPFLGLLGTVVGVMITFAAIAAAGDVNVNAIAPGIAAALLATVAGLAVAIPALFGYNYLISRVKNATTDMHVFIDEFVTKMAEFYRFRAE